jgi:sugar phosphate isomerase/epimerase
MRYGICTSITNAPILKSAGWDFVEENVQNFLQPELPDDQWQGEKLAKNSPLPIEAANVLVPAKLKITGPNANPAALKTHMSTVLRRAQQVGIKTLVFGSGGARKVDEGFDHNQARQQILDFAKMSADLASKHNVTLVAEHLNKAECNILNSIPESMEYVNALRHPNFECLVDTFHFWQENEPLETLVPAMPHIKHVHLADVSTRLAPGQTSQADADKYLPFFRVLKNANYDGRISVESGWKPELATDAANVLTRIKNLWNAA